MNGLMLLLVFMVLGNMYQGGIMKVGYTFMTIESPTFKKSFFRPNLFLFSFESTTFQLKTLSSEPLNVKLHDTLTTPSISVVVAE
jgi:hypothetical protein